ncbi:hypothetical protein A1A1_04782 [Planococcus antarcticus DSM 14505]|uniref:Lipoprotein n=1 Tax=Planococcus antarcticus DSM 14505 TaxID=1185653 RepID=A0AA87LS10_9BACL|nr:membrane lipoprotein lipid attachment site-containing protein [Planococcus antarcticus]EIM07498.1 hypothetical protein A1A1_04782 [Planococcus antarcticus DSM 14505]
MKKIIGLLVLMVILSGCGNDSNRYNFAASGENWDAFYVVNVSNGDREEKSGTVKFTGEGEAPEIINYKIETNSGGTEATGVTVNNGVVDIGKGFCDGCAVIQGDEEIEVEITWDGQTEKLLLKNDK